MTEDNAEAPRKKRRATEYTKHRTQIGIGLQFATRRIKKRDGSYTDFIEHRMKVHYKGALEGDVSSMKVMMRVISRNIEAARKQGYFLRTAEEMKARKAWEKSLAVIEGTASADAAPAPANADLALFILGIAGVGDPTLGAMGEPGSPKYVERLKALSPTKFEPWFLREMLARAESLGLEDDCKAINNRLSYISTNFSEWHANKDRYIEDLMRVRGPRATQFVPGQSGNLNGRPPKADIKFPYDGWLMQMIEMRVHGRMRKISRMDAMLFRLATMDATKHPGVAAQVTVLLMRLHEAGWKAPFTKAEVVEQDYDDLEIIEV